jgi:UDPglucose--hexose-1-phosphate uridylyltransferase
MSECSSHYYHWYLAIVPRVSHVAGFELGSGMFINSLLPEHAAENLRGVAIAS